MSRPRPDRMRCQARAARTDFARAFSRELKRAAAEAARIDDARTAPDGARLAPINVARILLRVTRFYRVDYVAPPGYDARGAALPALRDARTLAQWRELGGHVRQAYGGADWDDGAFEGDDWYPETRDDDFSAAVVIGAGLDAGDPDTGVVRVLVVSDDTGCGIDDIIGDGWDDTRQSVAARKRAERRVSDAGVWGVVAQYRLTADPDAPAEDRAWRRLETIDGECWGFVGDDWIGEAPSEFLATAIEAREKALADRAAADRVRAAERDAVGELLRASRAILATEWARNGATGDDECGAIAALDDAVSEASKYVEEGGAL